MGMSRLRLKWLLGLGLGFAQVGAKAQMRPGPHGMAGSPYVDFTPGGRYVPPRDSLRPPRNPTRDARSAGSGSVALPYRLGPTRSQQSRFEAVSERLNEPLPGGARSFGIPLDYRHAPTRGLALTRSTVSPSNRKRAVDEAWKVTRDAAAVRDIGFFKVGIETDFLPEANVRAAQFEAYGVAKANLGAFHEFWRAEGFYGGYAFEITLACDLGNYFVYPMVLWSYIPYPRQAVYAAFYAGAGDLRFEFFPYTQVLFPTEAFRNLAMEVSGRSVPDQAAFRQALLAVMSQLQSQISDGLATEFRFNPLDVAVTRVLEGESGYLLDGFVDRPGKLHVAFQAVLDIKGPLHSRVFIPNGASPSVPERLRYQEFRIGFPLK